MVDSKLAFDIMARDDGASAVFDKVARAADRTGASLKKTGRISDDLAKSSANLTKARDQETNALDKVQIAEARLAEVRGNSKSKVSQIIAAEKALSKARREAAAAGNVAQKAAKDLGQTLDDEGKKAGKSFGSGLKKWLTGSGANLGKEGGTVFGSGFLGALKTPILGPAIVGVLTAAVVTVMPAVGAIAGGALVAGFGAGLIGLGVVFAAKSDRVKRIWKSTILGMGNDMRLLGVPFQATLTAMAGFTKKTFATFKPQLEAAFKGLAPAATEFGDQLLQAFEKLAPAVQPIATAMGAVLKSLGPAMQDSIGKITDGLISLSASVSANPNGLADFAKGIGDVTKALLDGISTLNNINGAFERFTGGTSLVDATMTTLRASVQTLFGPFTTLQSLMGAVGIKADSMNHSVKMSADTAKLWTQNYGLSASTTISFGGAASRSASAVGLLTGATATVSEKAKAAAITAAQLAETFARQWRMTQQANDALLRMSGILLTLSGSEIAYQQAIDDTTASIKENGKTHDINTAKGRANKTALDQVAASAQAQTVAMRNAGDGNVAAAKHAEGAQRSFIKLATQMGYTVPQARAMAQSLIKIPNVTRTAKLQANKKDLEAKLRSAEAALKSPHLSATKTAKLKAQIKDLQAGIASAKAALASVPNSKTVTIRINTYKNSIESKSVGGTPKSVALPGRAAGGPVTAGQSYVVGEHRPELFVPKVNGTILPKVPSAALGSSVAAGMAQGIRGGASSAVNAAADIANAILSKAREVLQISSPSKAFAQIGLYVNQGFSQGLRGSAKSVQSVMASLMSKVLNISFNIADARKSAQKAVATYSAQVAAATTTASRRAAQARLRQAKTELRNVNSIGGTLGTTKRRNAVIGMLQRENVLMQAMAKKRASIAASLKTAQSRLAAAIQIKAEFKKSITDSALAFNAITNIQPGDGRTHLAARDIIEQMQSTLERTRQFAANLARLKKLGLRSDLYKQIAEAGVDAGGATATALLGGGKGAVTQVNSIQAQISTAANNLGNTAANNMYQAGVNAAQGLVNGLLAKTKALDKASKKLADAIVAQIKKTLGIHSPSKVLAWHGSMAGQGFVQGIVGEYANVRRAGVSLGAAATPGQLRTVGSTARQSPSSGEQRIVFEFRSDGSPHMEYLVKEFRKYVSAYGGGDVQRTLGSNR